MLTLLKKFLIDLWKDDGGWVDWGKIGEHVMDNLPQLTIAAGGAVAGAVGGGPKHTSSSSQENLIASGTQTQTPNLSPEAVELIRMLQGDFANQLQSPLDINLSSFDRERTAGHNQLTSAFRGAREGVSSDLAGRGLSFSNPAASSLSNLRGQEATARGQWDAGINTRRQEQEFKLPFMIENLKRQRQLLGQSLFRSMPYGTTSTTDSTRNLTRDMQSVGSSNRIDAALAGGSAGLALGSSLGLPNIFGQDNDNSGGVPDIMDWDGFKLPPFHRNFNPNPGGFGSSSGPGNSYNTNYGGSSNPFGSNFPWLTSSGLAGEGFAG